MVLTVSDPSDGFCHPELVSGSVRGEGQERARGEEPETARVEMLKQVQHDVMINVFEQ